MKIGLKQQYLRSDLRSLSLQGEVVIHKVNLEKDDLEKLMCFVGTNAALLNEFWQDKIDFEEFIAKANFDENEFDMTWTFDDPEAFKDL